MATKKFNYEPIFPGYRWSVRLVLKADVPLFPEGAKLRAQVRVDPASPILATLSSEDGTIVRHSDEEIEVIIPENASRKWVEGSVMFDLVRTDLTPAKHLGIRLQVTVRPSVTAPR